VVCLAKKGGGRNHRNIRGRKASSPPSWGAKKKKKKKVERGKREQFELNGVMKRERKRRGDRDKTANRGKKRERRRAIM